MKKAEKHHGFIRMQIGSLELAKEQGVEQGLKKGVKQGLEQGIEKGKQHSQVEFVVNSYRIGLSISTISEVTGLSDDEIMLLLKPESVRLLRHDEQVIDSTTV